MKKTKKIKLNELKEMVKTILKEEEEKTFLKKSEILDGIKSLANAQGSYGRMLKSLRELEESDPEKYNKVMTKLEEKKFKDIVDFVMFIES
jgi:hypothetical protein